jgi:hypothetical protein
MFLFAVYMDRYGDCFHEGMMEVEQESYNIMAQGGAAYDTLTCEMRFKSMKDDRLCLSFSSFMITKCDVKLTVYSDKDSTGSPLVKFSCCFFWLLPNENIVLLITINITNVAPD